jgi:hypothetical protein
MFKHNDRYYTVGSSVTFEKLEAIKLSERTGHHIQYHVPEFLLQHQMHIEPEQDMWTLCIAHAQRIRKDYDYIRFWYSGGSDSHYMLKVFLAAGVYIDEIIMVKCGIPGTDWEIDDVAVKNLHKIKDQIPNTKIRIETKTIDNYYNTNNFWFDTNLKLSRASKCITYLRLNEELESINLYSSHGRTVNVVGIDKPNICYVNKRWYTYFIDAFDYQPGTDTNDFCCFYDDDPLIYAKQCHLLKRAIEKSVSVERYNTIKNSPEYEKLVNQSIQRVGTSEYFIPYKNNHDHPTVYSFNKKELDAKLYMQKNHPAVMEHYQAGIQHLKTISTRWWNNGDPEQGPVGCFSKFICIDEPKIVAIDELFPHGFDL